MDSKSDILEYKQLKDQIENAGLIDRRYGYYALKIISNLMLFTLAVYFLIHSHSVVTIILSILFGVFAMVQMTGVSHDAGHMEIFSSYRNNALIGLIHIGIFGGASFSWWFDKHNLHHSHPNEEDTDPDIDFPVVAFSHKQALEKRGFFRWIVKHQTLFYLFLVTLVPLNMRLHSLRIIFTGKSRYPVLELLFMIVHAAILISFFIWRFGVGWGLLILIIFHQLIGLYLASIFAPNHKGMPMVKKGENISFLKRQIITSRDVSAHPITDFLYLGLNYQIEHHLFPNMPRCNLRKAQIIVKKFCRKKGISYHETSFIQSYKEIYKCLDDAASILWKQDNLKLAKAT